MILRRKVCFLYFMLTETMKSFGQEPLELFGQETVASTGQEIVE
jgi:hypothetical protein